MSVGQLTSQSCQRVSLPVSWTVGQAHQSVTLATSVSESVSAAGSQLCRSVSQLAHQSLKQSCQLAIQFQSVMSASHLKNA